VLRLWQSSPTLAARVRDLGEAEFAVLCADVREKAGGVP
jgi:hypothetical protein